MANIWEFVRFNTSERPKYTRYELAKLVREKREQAKLSLDDVATQFNVDVELWKSIENASRSFNVKIYKIISAFLDMSISELLAKDVDDMAAISFRANDKEENEEISEAIYLANLIFDEMVMQEKLSSH
ncbi:helix-turn-helix transcriptional regulator [Paenibacillus sp. 3LSP]|jgi:transcriptional regulator with XRE-family HTH domain|uniref:helix-turn-helix domain-containing protein n=1 Tax=Paenibacillus sp. 3LSP TaxID=2800795 RepID=UPI0028FD1363|nr:helix-turn-helix transcriptional regulator [Paenibacillus sp. 3LSP]MDU0331789.1 helix-turn-helix transcriptional regulator [Paenibacillus sp. 3LSP]